MPERYVLAVGDPRAVDGAEAWAESHASQAGVPLVRVHVDGSNPDAVHRPTPDSPMTDVVHIAGRIPEALARFVRDDDILVIGTGKTGFIRSRVFGTVSLQIADAVGCTVAVVPQVDLRFRTGIVAGVKNDDLLPAIVHAAVAEARSCHQPVQVVHSSFAALVPAPLETRGPALDQATALASTGGSDANVRTRATARPPAEALLDASRNASLLVIGPGHRRGTGHAIGSVTHDVLMNINAPVLIVRRSPTDPEDSRGDTNS